MLFTEIKQKIENNQKFKEFKEKNPKLHLCAGFFIIPLTEGESPQQHLDYYLPDEKKIAGFDIEGNYKIEEQMIEKPMQVLENVQLNIDEIIEIVQAELDKKQIKSKLNKVIAVIQSMGSENIWILSCFLGNMDFIKIKIKDSDKQVLDYDKTNLMNFVFKNKKEEKTEMSQKEVWNAVSDKWAEYRDKEIPEVQDFLKTHKKGKILDLACGSGRNFCKVDGKLFAVDFSENMLKKAKEKAKKYEIDCECLAAECTSLPIKDNFFDSAIFIAALHCIEGEQRRKKSLQELFRVLKPKAEAMVSVWNLDDSRGDKIIPWKLDGVEHKRYYYFYDKEELSDLLKDVGFEIISFLKNDLYKPLSPKDNKKLHKNNLVFIVRKP